MMGAMYFNEFKSIDVTQLILFIVSIIIILLGIAVLTFNFGEYVKNNKNNKNNDNFNHLQQKMISP